MNDTLITAAVFAAFIALIISLINAYRVTKIKKQCEVDILNQKEDMKITWDKVKRSLSGDVKNLRRDLNKINRPQTNKPKTKTDIKKQENTTADKAKEENTTKKQAPAKPKGQNNRNRNYKPRRKPVQKKETKQESSDS